MSHAQITYKLLIWILKSITLHRTKIIPWYYLLRLQITHGKTRLIKIPSFVRKTFPLVYKQKYEMCKIRKQPKLQGCVLKFYRKMLIDYSALRFRLKRYGSNHDLGSCSVWSKKTMKSIGDLWFQLFGCTIHHKQHSCLFAHQTWAKPPKCRYLISPTLKHTVQESGGKLCKIFCSQTLWIMSANLFGLMGNSYPNSLPGLRPWTLLGPLGYSPRTKIPRAATAVGDLEWSLKVTQLLETYYRFVFKSWPSTQQGHPMSNLAVQIESPYLLFNKSSLGSSS